MEIIDNINNLLGDNIKQELQKGSKLKIAASCFSIYAFEALKDELQKIESLEFIFTSPTFVPEETVGNIKKDRSSEDLLFQVLLDWGVDLSLPIIREEIAGKEVFFVDGNALVACFDKGINEEFVNQLAIRKPLRVVFRDDGFGSGKDGDSVRINVEQVFKLKSPTTDIMVI